MSGLVQFFSKFLNNNKNDDNNDDNSDRGEDHHNEKEQYKRSLADLSQPIGDEDGGVDDGEQPEYTDYAFDYKMWKTRRNEILEAFAEKRFSTPLHENDDDDKQEEEEETQDLDETQQSQGLDTQEQETSNALETQEEGQGLPQKHSRQRKPGRKVIPHCRYETLHNVHFMEDIDLYTRTANLNLCLVTKVFDYRECERYAATSAYIPRYLPIIETSNGAMLNVRNLPITEDGPLSTVYDHCLSIEVQQLIHRPDKQALATTAANWIPTSSRKMRIFFYDDYAAAIRDTLLNLDARNQMVLLRAQDINAASIIPYAVGHWFDYQELYEECICIGATSKMMVNLGDGPKKFQFVTSNLRLQIAIGNKETGDFQVGFDITNGPDDTERVNVEEYTPPEDTLFEKFRSWKKSWQEVNDDDKEPTDIVGSPDEEMENVDPEDRQHQHRQQQQQQRPDKPQEQQTQQLGTPNQQHRATASDKQTSQLCDEEDKEQSADHSNRKKRDPQSPSQGLRHQKRAKSSTKYTRLSELESLLTSHKQMISRNNTSGFAGRRSRDEDKCYVNLYGVIVAFKLPQLAKTGQWFMSIELVDESISPGDHSEEDVSASEEWKSVSLVIFEKQRERLPSLKAAGDVLRLHRVVVQEFQGELQLKGEFRTGFAIYDGQPGADEDGRNHGIRAPTRFEYTEGDLPRFKGLWKWGQARIGHKPTIKANYRSTLGQILHQYERDGAINNNGASTTNEASSKSSDKDYTVMISSMIPFPGDQRTGATPMGFLRVWDGTGPSTADRMPVRVPRTVRDLTTEALSKISEIKEHRGGRPQFDPPQRFHGRVVNVVIWEKEHWEYLCHQNGIVGTFIRLRNARERFFDEIGIRCLFVNDKTSLFVLPSETFEVLDLLANHNERISQGGQDFNPVSGVLPMDLDETVIKPVSKRRTEQPARRVNPTVTSLEDFRTSGNKMYNGRVHVTGVAGASVDSPHDMRKLCRSSNYRFALRLSDGTAGLMAMVPDVCGRQFFGMPAAEACGSHSRSAFETLSHRIRQREDLVVDIRKVVVDGATYYILNTVSGV